jgi:para-aminobenzoate synthetase component II
VTRFRVLVVDNHDSFVHTLADYLRELGADVVLVEADAIPIDAVADALTGHDAVLVSPGPGDPEHAGASIAVVRAAADGRIPLLGVCLGHQAIAVAFGGDVVHAPELVHDGSVLFTGMPQGFSAARYHSLAVRTDSVPSSLAVTAVGDTGVIRALEHRDAPVWGVQFHPESILTEGGYRVLGNWLEASGMPGAAERGTALHPRGAVTGPCTP